MAASGSTKIVRWVSAAAAGATLLAVQLVTPSPAFAVPILSGLQQHFGSSAANSSASVQTAVAVCPEGKVVVGGGGGILDQNNTRRLALTQLEPSDWISTDDGHRVGYLATAAETGAGVTSFWQVQAWALCANPIPGRAIYQMSTLRSSQAVQATKIACPTGQVVLGSGARVSNPIGPTGQQVSLQIARPSQTGDIARAQAHEDPDGYSGSWSITASAICAPKPLGYQVVFAPSADASTAAVKTARATCPTNGRVISAGAAMSNVAPGHASLSEVNPLSNQVVRARATENFSTTQDWDYIIASAVCARAF